MSDDQKALTIRRIQDYRVSAILRTDDAQTAKDAMNAAVDGGFRMIEFTLTTPGAIELIQEFSARQDLLVGAGTVLTVEQARTATKAGAKFLVSPVFDPQIVAEARSLDAVSIPGAFTPTEMFAAHKSGADFVKLFPSPGDVAQFVSAVLAPMPFLRIFPTAGVTADNFLAVLASGAAGVGFVKSLFDPAELSAKNYSAIQARARRIIGML
ncbi:MAG: bifunctional 4-hydroxy-2-oxoglutarate aldolase/2-dehydro-3-deoxy-phosphogluconate aldolase [Planctomycetia bacterium]|nr:bifunctional 4-hydroxy-2-oxoglutarate aldolase/2-dehydro-3-deoxy-phosphogluconate aldolase [Planctomycetia bacterium]